MEGRWEPPWLEAVYLSVLVAGVQDQGEVIVLCVPPLSIVCLWLANKMLD